MKKKAFARWSTGIVGSNPTRMLQSSNCDTCQEFDRNKIKINLFVLVILNPTWVSYVESCHPAQQFSLQLMTHLFYSHLHAVFCNQVILPNLPILCILLSFHIWNALSFNFNVTFLSPTFKQPVCIHHISFLCHVVAGHTSSKVRKFNSVTHTLYLFLRRNISSFYQLGLFSAVCACPAASVTTCYTARGHT
jgi:hypothetical protein